MPKLSIEYISPTQREMMSATERYIAFGGARGGGKSWALQRLAVLYCLKYHGLTLLLLRRTYSELRQNHIEPLCKLCNCYALDKTKRLATYNDSSKTMTFPATGSRIIFGYMDTDSDALRYQGNEYDIIMLDEATQQPEDRFKALSACIRGTNCLPKRFYLTCNPGGIGHEWVKRLFIDRKYNEGEKPEQYKFIQSRVTDNKPLMESNPEYIDILKSLPPKTRKAWLYGDWDSFEGAFFSEFRTSPDPDACAKAGITEEQALEQRRWTHVIKPIDLNSGAARGWTIYRSYDFGYNKPFSCAWWAVDYDGVMYRILELYGCTDTPNEGVRWSPEYQFRRIRDMELHHPWLQGRKIQGVADPSIWDASRGISIAEEAERHGIYFDPGDNHRIAGWMQCHYRLQFDSNGYPRMYVFDNCRAFIRTVPLLMYDEHNPEDLDTSLEDHAADEWRYMCMSRPIQPIIVEQTEIPAIDPLNQFDKYRR